MNRRYEQSPEGIARDNAALRVYDNLPIDERNEVMRQAKRLNKKLRNVGQYSSIEAVAALGVWAVENNVDLRKMADERRLSRTKTETAA